MPSGCTVIRERRAIWTFFVEPTSDNAARVLSAMKEFGFGDLGITQADLENTESFLQLGTPPFRIGILKRLSGITFDDAWSGRVERKIDGVTIRFLGRDELIKNKTASGRLQDLADVEKLRRRK